MVEPHSPSEFEGHLLGGVWGVLISDNLQSFAVRYRPSFDGDISLERYRKDCLICKFDMNLRSALAVFVDIAATNHFACKFSAFDHGLLWSPEEIALTQLGDFYPALPSR
jgi:hypothetical protein